MAANLLATKMFVPPSRPGIIQRPRLFELLDSGVNAGNPLTLVAAPAGYGKSVLVSEWARHRASIALPGERINWLSLENAELGGSVWCR